jgi:hypothetical protein
MPKGKKKGQNVKIYARVRCLMPWEPKDVSLSVKGNVVRNSTDSRTNEYTFQRVFNVDITNEQIFKVIVEPMISNVLDGFNAVLIAYGQTGSGKTFSMLGKPKLDVIGLLPYMLKVLVETATVTKVELRAVEAFGHHVARIELYDLFDPDNQTKVWADKKGNTSLDMSRARRVQIKDMDDAYQQIIYAHAASHFAPTGKNPESSRGHVTFIATVHQNDPDDPASTLQSNFLMLDCAGSEGESAFTKEYIAQVDKTTLMARRLEAGCINNGLSQLQMIFNELRTRGKLAKVLGNGLRRVLHPFINTRTFLSVLFTLSPARNNAQSTESTMKFAVAAGMVKVAPVKMESKMNMDKLVDHLRSIIAKNDKSIEEQADAILELRAKLEMMKQDAVSAGELAADFVLSDDEDEEDGSGSDTERGHARLTDGTSMTTSLMRELSAWDEMDDGEDMELDEMFLAPATEGKALTEEELDRELSDGLKQMEEVATGDEIVKGALDGFGDDDSKSSDDKVKSAMEQLKATLVAAAGGDVDLEDFEAPARDTTILDALASMDTDSLDKVKVAEVCDKAFDKIDDNIGQQQKLKKSQGEMVSHLIETDEWLFGTLSEVLSSK